MGDRPTQRLLKPKPHIVVRVLNAVAVSAGLGVTILVLLLAGLWLEHRREITLPTPTGHFAVGRTTFVWTDASPDPLAPGSGSQRELLAWVWYPSPKLAAGAPTSDYLPVWLRSALARSRGPVNTRLLTRDLSRVRAHAVWEADLSPEPSTLPVVVMRGGGSLEVANYSTLAEDLASHGYVVVGFDAPYRTGTVAFPDGRVVRRLPNNNPELCRRRADQDGCLDRILIAWTSDIALALDRLEQLTDSAAAGRFEGRLDMARVGVFGHSFGGAIAATFCSRDLRCRAGINIDGALHGRAKDARVEQPFMLLTSDHGREADPETSRIREDLDRFVERLPVETRAVVAIRGAHHNLFSDDGALLKSALFRQLIRLFGGLGIDGRRQLAATAFCVRSFFDACLGVDAATPPRLSSPLFQRSKRSIEESWLRQRDLVATRWRRPGSTSVNLPVLL